MSQPWMQTYTGRAFYPLNPEPDNIDPEDIAHALSMLCRYGGHTRRFYSVAEHCVLMSHAVPLEHALWALLHDATEAYMSDLIAPLKAWMPEYRAAEARLMEAICERFRLPPYSPWQVKDADLRILLDERAALLTTPPQEWDLSIETAQPLGVTIHCWTPAQAERRYRERLAHLLVNTEGTFT